MLSEEALNNAINKAISKEGDVFAKASVILIELVRSHPFASGTRRTAYAATVSFLRVNGTNPKLIHDPSIFKGIREGFYTEKEVVNWLRGNAVKGFARG